LTRVSSDDRMLVARSVEPRKPTSVMTATVTTKPSPGIGKPNHPSMVEKMRTHTYNVTAMGATKMRPRRKYVRNRRTIGSYVALAMAALGYGLGCGSAQIPETSYVAPGSTPEPLRIEIALPNHQPIVRARALRVLTDSQFQVSRVESSAIAGYSLRRLIEVHIEVLPDAPAAKGRPHRGVARSVSRLAVSGERYVGDATRRDSIAALPERWRLISASDPGAATLHNIARAIQIGVLPASEFDGADAERGMPELAEMPGPDSATLERLAGIPVGRTVDLCSPAILPAGWLPVYWFTDRSRCASGRGHAFPGEPNMLRVEREW
jgi:hypothetical protein